MSVIHMKEATVGKDIFKPFEFESSSSVEKFNLIQNQFVDLLEKLQFLIESTEVGWMQILSHKWSRKKRYPKSRMCGC